MLYTDHYLNLLYCSLSTGSNHSLLSSRLSFSLLLEDVWYCRLAHCDGTQHVRLRQCLQYQHPDTSWRTGSSVVHRMVRHQGEVSRFTCRFLPLLGVAALDRAHSHCHHFPRLYPYLITHYRRIHRCFLANSHEDSSSHRFFQGLSDLQ